MLIRPTISGWIGSDVVGGLAVVGGEHHVRDARSPMPRRSVVIGVGGCCARACRLPRELWLVRVGLHRLLLLLLHLLHLLLLLLSLAREITVAHDVVAASPIASAVAGVGSNAAGRPQAG